MCLILFAFRSHPRYKLILAANRDEYFNRPTEPAAYLSDTPSLLAGKDLKAGGTWLGITKDGKIAAVTNYRGSDPLQDDAKSRGSLLNDYLSGKIVLEEFLEWLPVNGKHYNGFNLIFGTIDKLYYFSNRSSHKSDSSNNLPEIVQPDIHGISNAFLDTPWPKVKKGKQALEQRVLTGEDISIESLFSLLKNTTGFPDAELPDTGIGIDYERILSPLFIETNGYGTRSSTVILVDTANRVTFAERSFVPPAEKWFRFKIENLKKN